MSAKPAKTEIPWAGITVCALLLIGYGLAVGALFILYGLGWAMLGGALPCFGLAVVIMRGLNG